MKQRIRLGMVGGGQGAFIGNVHRIAARIDDEFDLVAGCLSSDPKRAAASAAEIGLARPYASYAEMAEAERARPDGVEAVSIVTPNHLHAPIAKVFLDAGIHVICDKPLTAQLEDAKALSDFGATRDPLFILTHNYLGYPLVREARDLVAEGVLGDLRLVQVEYLQGWLADVPPPDQKQAAWRLDPAKAGTGALGDIGSHAQNLACFISGQTVTSVAAHVSRVVPGRQVDDNVHAQLRFSGGATGSLWASQVAIGHENDLSIRLYGSKGGLIWRQECPNRLEVTKLGAPTQILTRGAPYLGEAAQEATRVPPGHPEGYLEGFATIYKDAAAAIRAHGDPTHPAAKGVVTTLVDGLGTMCFIDACLRSSSNGGAWTDVDA